jgi:catalase (peroxidase I)
MQKKILYTVIVTLLGATIDSSITSDVVNLSMERIDQEKGNHIRQLQGSMTNSELTTSMKPILQATSGLQLPGYPTPAAQLQYEKDLSYVNWTDVSDDLAMVLKDSKDWWPADYGTYGPFMMRLSWHACGSYRRSDGRGGCDGGGIRYDPERSWPDNTNLDKAKQLLEPIKLKYGNGLSWGDLFALVGTVAIREMGGPDIGFCAGRQDVQDNSQTLPLGPSIEQERFAKCPVNGKCPFPLGSNTLGLVRNLHRNGFVLLSLMLVFFFTKANFVDVDFVSDVAVLKSFDRSM